MATKTTKKQTVLTVEQRYQIADELARQYHFSKEYLSEHRRVAFGVIINTPNKNGQTMSSVLGDDVATHITNLTINRLLGSNQAKVVCNLF